MLNTVTSSTKPAKIEVLAIDKSLSLQTGTFKVRVAFRFDIQEQTQEYYQPDGTKTTTTQYTYKELVDEFALPVWMLATDLTTYLKQIYTSLEKKLDTLDMLFKGVTAPIKIDDV